MKKFIIYLVSLCTVFTSTVPVSAKQKTDEPKIKAKTAIVMDATTGQVLYHKYMYKKKYPASLTKLMTVLLTLENCDLNEKVTFSEEAVFGIEYGSSNIGIVPGEVLTVEQCLYGMMLESANEVCSAMAEHISGSVDEFALLMTKRAKELGCKNTNFTNANGLHDDNHYTTAYDLSLILKELLKNPEFRKVASARNYRLKKTNKSPARWLGNHHKMVRYPTGSMYSISEPLTVTSGKTAFTMKAKTCLSTSATNGEMELICIVMDDSGVDVYWDTKALFDYTFKKYQHVTPLTTYNTMPTEEINLIAHNFFELLRPQKLDLTVDKDYVITLPKDADLSKIETTVTKDLNASDNILGTLHILYNNEEVGQTLVHFSDFTSPPIIVKDSKDELNLSHFNFKNFRFSSLTSKEEIVFIAGTTVISLLLLVFLLFYIRLILKRRTLRFHHNRRRNRLKRR